MSLAFGGQEIHCLDEGGGVHDGSWEWLVAQLVGTWNGGQNSLVLRRRFHETTNLFVTDSAVGSQLHSQRRVWTPPLLSGLRDSPFALFLIVLVEFASFQLLRRLCGSGVKCMGSESDKSVCSRERHRPQIKRGRT